MSKKNIGLKGNKKYPGQEGWSSSDPRIGKTIFPEIPDDLYIRRNDEQEGPEIPENIFSQIGRSVGNVVKEKNDAYGDAFSESCKIIDVLYPTGIKPHQYKDFLSIIRIIDKLFRIANKKDAFEESPWEDIAGYAILSMWREEK